MQHHDRRAAKANGWPIQNAMKLWRVAALLLLASCGDGDQVLNAGHTIHGSLWTSFYATVTEHYNTVALSDVDAIVGLSASVATDIWSVDNAGLAQYLSSQPVNGYFGQAPQTVAVKKLDPQALTGLKNALARYRVFSWSSTITCGTVTCRGDQGTGTLEVNLNGETKTVSWPLYASGLPEGLEAMSQLIKDAI